VQKSTVFNIVQYQFSLSYSFVQEFTEPFWKCPCRYEPLASTRMKISGTWSEANQIVLTVTRKKKVDICSV